IPRGAEAPVRIGAEAELHELVVAHLEELVGVDVQGEVLVVEAALARQVADAIACQQGAGEDLRTAQLLVGQAEVPVVQDHGVAGGVEPARLQVEPELAGGVEQRGIAGVGGAEHRLLLVLEARQRIGDARGEIEAAAPHLAVRGEYLGPLAAIQALGQERTGEQEAEEEGEGADHRSKGIRPMPMERGQWAGSVHGGVWKHRNTRSGFSRVRYCIGPLARRSDAVRMECLRPATLVCPPLGKNPSGCPRGYTRASAGSSLLLDHNSEIIAPTPA